MVIAFLTYLEYKHKVYNSHIVYDIQQMQLGVIIYKWIISSKYHILSSIALSAPTDNLVKQGMLGRLIKRTDVSIQVLNNVLIVHCLHMFNLSGTRLNKSIFITQA